MLGARCSSHASATCIDVAPSAVATSDSAVDCRRSEAAEREERHVGGAVPGEVVNQRVVVSMRQVVHVLHARDRADTARVGDLRRRHVAQADVAHETLQLQFGQRSERLLERAVGRSMDAEHAAKVDDVEDVQAEVAKVVVNRVGQCLARHGRDPRTVRAAPGADLGDDDQVVTIRMQRLADDLVGDVRAVIVAAYLCGRRRSRPPCAARRSRPRDPWEVRRHPSRRAASRHSRRELPRDHRKDRCLQAPEPISCSFVELLHCIETSQTTRNSVVPRDLRAALRAPAPISATRVLRRWTKDSESGLGLPSGGWRRAVRRDG